MLQSEFLMSLAVAGGERRARQVRLQAFALL